LAARETRSKNYSLHPPRTPSSSLSSYEPRGRVSLRALSHHDGRERLWLQPWRWLLSRPPRPAPPSSSFTPGHLQDTGGHVPSTAARSFASLTLALALSTLVAPVVAAAAASESLRRVDTPVHNTAETVPAAAHSSLSDASLAAATAVAAVPAT